MVRRGDLVVISAPGDYGKPRPAVVVQSDRLSLGSVLVAQVTSEIVDAPLYRLTIAPSAATGLQNVSQVMVDKIVCLRRDKCDRVIGRSTRRHSWLLTGCCRLCWASPISSSPRPRLISPSHRRIVARLLQQAEYRSTGLSSVRFARLRRGLGPSGLNGSAPRRAPRGRSVDHRSSSAVRSGNGPRRRMAGAHCSSVNGTVPARGSSGTSAHCW